MKINKLIFITVIGSLLGSCALPQPVSKSITPTTLATQPPIVTPTVTPTPMPTMTPTPAATVRIGMGDEAYNQGDYDTALTDYQEALRNSSDSEIESAALLGIGKIQVQSERIPAALETFHSLLEQYPISSSVPDAHFYTAQLYTKLERYSEASGEYQKYLDLRPGVLDSYVQELRGDTLISSQNYTEAIKAFQASIQAPHLGDDSATQLKIARAYASNGDYTTAIGLYTSLYQSTGNDYTKAELDLLSGQAYIALGDTTKAYGYFNDAVNNYPRSYDSYSALSALIDAGITVDPLNRGLVDYYAGQYLPAIDVLKDYIKKTPDHDGTAHYYLAMCYTNQEEYVKAIAEWDALIRDHKGDRFWSTAWDEKAYLQWYYLDKYEQAAQTLLDFITGAASDPQAANFLFEAGRIYERGNLLEKAAATWDRLATEYPGADRTYLGIFMSGITRYRMGNYQDALLSFQRGLVLASVPADKASANLWIGKTQEKLNEVDAAKTSWQQAAEADPTGYYSERARDLLLNRAPFSSPAVFDLAYDLNGERPEAESWMRQTFNLSSDTDLASYSEFQSDTRVIQGDEYIRLGLFAQARDEFEDLRTQYQTDPVATYKLTNMLLARGMTRSAVFAARQVLTLAGMDDTATFKAPIFFNHIRFGAYYKDIVLQAAGENNQDPLLLFALIRQESLFEPFISSSAGAEGLTQLMPATAKEIAANLGWPAVVNSEDVFRPLVSIRLGAYYLNQMKNQTNGDLYAALAAYNAGLGSSNTWKSLSGDDPDLFLEVTRYEETRNYIRSIVELYNIYRRFYNRTP